MPDASHRAHRLNGLLLAAAALLATAAAGIAAQPAAASGWVITFEDSFDGPNLDRAKWYTRYIYNNGKMDHFNDEKQRYRDKNHVFKDGILNLVAEKPNAKGLYPSGMIRSRQTFRYGYFEARIKMPSPARASGRPSGSTRTTTRTARRPGPPPRSTSWNMRRTA